MADLYSPRGTRIIGTREIIPGTCGITNVRRNEHGRIEFDFDDNGTDIDWDGQETVVEHGQRSFVDEDGTIWSERVLDLRG